MKVKDKLVRAKEAILSIAAHDDDPAEQIKAALDELKAYMDSEYAKAVQRRKEKPEAKK